MKPKRTAALCLSLLMIVFFLSACRRNEQTTVKIDKDTVKAVTHVRSALDSIQAAHRRKDSALANSYDIPTSTLGIGLVLALDRGETIELYDDSLLKDKYYSWSQITSKDDSAAQERNQLGSKYCMTDLSVCDYVCLKKTRRAYQVLHNYDGVKYLPNNKRYPFKTWSDYIVQSYGVRLGTYDTGGIRFRQPFRAAPSITADTLTIPDDSVRFQEFCPIEVKGDWLKVQYNCFAGSDNSEAQEYEGQPCHEYIHHCKRPLIGYLQWKRGKEVLIDILLRS